MQKQKLSPLENLECPVHAFSSENPSRSIALLNALTEISLNFKNDYSLEIEHGWNHAEITREFNDAVDELKMTSELDAQTNDNPTVKKLETARKKCRESFENNGEAHYVMGVVYHLLLAAFNIQDALINNGKGSNSFTLEEMIRHYNNCSLYLLNISLSEPETLNTAATALIKVLSDRGNSEIDQETLQIASPHLLNTLGIRFGQPS